MTLKTFLALILIFSRRAAAVSEWTGSALAERHYYEGLAAYQEGQYQKAMESFMDALLEDPQYPEAQEHLTQAGRQLVRLQELSVEMERNRLMKEIEHAEALKGGIFKQAPALLAAWKQQLQKAVKQAQTPGALLEALESYLEALHDFPVYHNYSGDFDAGREEFQKALTTAFPLAAGPLKKNGRSRLLGTGDLAEIILGEKHYAETMKSGLSGPLIVKEDKMTVYETRLLSQLTQTEKNIDSALFNANEAYQRLADQRLRESAEFWKLTLKADPGNSEASYFLAWAADEIKKTPPPAPAAPAASTWVPATAQEIQMVHSMFEAEESQPSSRGQRRIVPRKKKPAAVPEENPRPSAPETAIGVAAAADSKSLAQEYYERGLRSYALGRLDDAVAQWTACLGLDPSHPKAKKALARAAMEKR